jgi:DNA-directed RNA polymerase subunit RPC12/RpoP
MFPYQKKETMGRLIVQCLKTCETIDTGIATDYKSLSKSWEKTLHIACPHCGEEHEVKVRDAFIRAAVSDIVVHGIPEL